MRDATTTICDNCGCELPVSDTHTCEECGAALCDECICERCENSTLRRPERATLNQLVRRASDEQLRQLLGQVRAAAKRRHEGGGAYPIAFEWAVRQMCMGRTFGPIDQQPDSLRDWCRDRLLKIMGQDEG